MWRITREITDGANTPSKNTAIKIKDKTWKAVYKKIDHIQFYFLETLTETVTPPLVVHRSD